MIPLEYGNLTLIPSMLEILPVRKLVLIGVDFPAYTFDSQLLYRSTQCFLTFCIDNKRIVTVLNIPLV